MVKLDVLERYSPQIFHSIENHDFTFIPSIGTVSLLQFLSKVENTKYLFISDDRSISAWFTDFPFQTSIYDSRFSAINSSLLTYDLCVYLISEDNRFFELFDFVVFDDLDSRGAKSDYVFSLVTNLKMKGKFVLPMRSTFKIDLYTIYVERFGYSSNVLNLLEQPLRNTYYLPSETVNGDINNEIIETINDILTVDLNTNPYEILVLLSSNQEIQLFRNKLLDGHIEHDFSILTDIRNYKTPVPHRRIIVTDNSKMFNDIDHQIRYIVDSGILEVRKFDESGLQNFQKMPTNKNQVTQNLSILQNENSSYFGMVVEDSLGDFSYEIMNYDFVVQFLYLLKMDKKVDEFVFLRAPGQEIIRNAITFLIYLGLVTLNGDGDGGVELTDIGKIVMKFQLNLSISSLSLFTALSTSKKFYCVKEILKIASVILSTNENMLSNDLRDGHKTATLAQSDFVTIVDIFDSIIENEQHIKLSKSCANNNVSTRSTSNKETRKQILHCFKRLRDCLNHPLNSDSAHEDEIHKCLFMGYQFHTGSIMKYVSNQALTIVPIKKPIHEDEEPAQIQFIIKSNEAEADQYEDNDIVIYHSYDRDRNNGIHYYVNLTSKIDKRLINQMNLPLYRLH